MFGYLSTILLFNYHGTHRSLGGSVSWFMISYSTGFTEWLMVLLSNELLLLQQYNNYFVEINIFWAAHQMHHSSEEYNLSTALRQSALQKFTSWVSKVISSVHLSQMTAIRSLTSID